MVTDILFVMLNAPQAQPDQSNEMDVSFLRPETTSQPTSVEPPAIHKLDLSDNSKPPRKTNFFRRHAKLLSIIGIVVLLLGGTVAAVGAYTYQTAMTMKNQGMEAKATAQLAYAAFKAQNLPETQNHLKTLKTQEETLRQTYARLGFYKFVPIASRYYQDGLHSFNAAEAGLRAGQKSLEAITPYADVLGFAGEGTFTGGTAEDRLKVVLQTVDKVVPVLDEITAELQTMENELKEIDPAHYPEQIRGQQVRSQITQVQELGTGAVTALTEFRPVIEQLPAIAGAKDGRKKYLVLFQNDNELRPTGGFLTAYATIFIEDGKVIPEKSDDIYELDKKFRKNIPIPEALGRYLTTERRWNLRDMNTSPDFRVSMDQFMEHYLEVPGEPTDIDGVIAVDTEFLTDLLRVLGPVEIPGYGTFSAENSPACDCPQVVHALSEIITRPTPYLRQDRKGILGPMMRAILTKAYGAPKQQWPELFQLGFDNIASRDIQMYYMDENAQKAAEAINAAGRLTYEDNADLLAIVNANLGGAKSNLFVDYEVSQVVEAPQNGEIVKTVEIRYRNNRRADNCNLEAGLLCLNSTLRDWTRLYMPAGSKLISAQGFTEEAKEYDENGFHVIDGFFTLEPLGQATLKLTYSVPYTDTETYRVKLWKQGGINPVKTVMEVTGGQEEVLMDKDIIYETKF
jgi:hypothetical protein